MAFIERFSQVVKGDLIFIGNTLGLSKGENKNIAGKIGSNGCFISLDKNEKVDTFPNGTTLDYKKNGSSAVLNLPKDSEVLYAELVWSGIYKSNSLDITKELSKPISFITPIGKYSINPEYRTKQNCIVNLTNLSLEIYSRSADVTQYVQKSMSGTYSACEIPALLSPIDNDTNRTNFAGWTLIVAFKNDRLSPKRISFNVGCETVYKDFGNIDINLSKFHLPLKGTKNSKILISAGEGDAEIIGDSVYFGNNPNNLKQIFGINNPINNFFSSQINNEYGEIDLLSSFSDRNHDAINNTNIDAGRQGYDITTINLKDFIENQDYSNPIVRFSSDGDLYFPNAIGISIENLSANLRVTKSSDKQKLIWGDIVTYTIEIQNIGDLTAEDIALFECLPKSLTLIEHSIKVNDISYKGTFPIALPDLNKNEKNIVTFKMRVPNNRCKAAKNVANVKYSYVLPSKEKIKETSNSNVVCLYPEDENEKVEIIKNVDKSTANLTDILTYTNTINNIGDVTIKNLFFYDSLPNEVIFIPGSVYIDGINYKELNPITGFNVDDIQINQSRIIEFKVKIK